MSVRGGVLAVAIQGLIPMAIPGRVEGRAPARYSAILTERSRVTRGDCLVALGLFLDLEGDPADLQSLGSRLVQRGVLTPFQLRQLRLEEGVRWLEIPDPVRADHPTRRLASRGFACLLFSRALRKRDSLLGWLFHGSERYAYRSLLARRLVPPGGSQVPMTGLELMGLLRQARSPD